MNKLSIFMLIATASLMTTSTAHAVEKDIFGIYVGARAGAAFSPRLSQNDVTSQNYDTGGGGNFVLGYRFNSGLRFELTLGFLINEASDSADDMLVAGTGMASLLYDIPTGIPVYPLLGVGLGFIRTGKVHNKSGDYIIDDDFSHAYQAIAGLGYRVNDHVTIDLQYRYLQSTGDVEYSNNVVELGATYTFLGI